MVGRIKGFDGVRAIAALLVVLGHANWTQQVMGQGPGKLVFETILSPLRGVHIFFVLSGFLISRILWRELSLTGTIDYGKFMRRRALRLLPAYLFYLGIVACLSLTGVLEGSLPAYLAALTYTYNYLPPSLGLRFLTHLWSLAVEAQFYLVFPLLMMKLSRQSLLLTLALSAVAFIFLSPLLDALPMPDLPVPRQGEVVNLGDFRAEDIFRMSHFFIPAAASCFIGCFVGLLSEKIIATRPRSFLPLALGTLLYLHPALLQFHYEWYTLTVQMIGVGLVLVDMQHRQSSLLVRVLDAAPLRFLGKISYGTYLWQGLFIGTGAASVIYWWQGLWYGFAFSYLAAILSYYFVELPFLRKKRKLT